MKKIYLILVLFLSVSFVFSQTNNGNAKTKNNRNVNNTKVLPLIPNPSFEDHSCCPSTFSQMSCCDYWAQGTDATADYFNCGYNFGAATNAGLNPPPDGTGYVGAIFAPGWQEYFGISLPSPMLPGISYSISMDIASTPIDSYGDSCNGGIIDYSDIDITIFGASDSNLLPYSTNGCPDTNIWHVIATAPYTPVDHWDTITFNFTLTDTINAIMIGSPCNLPANYTYGPCYPYFYFDNLSSAITDVDNKKPDSHFVNIYPNPGNGIFSIDYDIGKGSQASLEIYSLSGELLKQEIINNNSGTKALDLSKYAEGIYMIKLETEKEVLTQKVVIH